MTDADKLNRAMIVAISAGYEGHKAGATDDEIIACVNARLNEVPEIAEFFQRIGNGGAEAPTAVETPRGPLLH